MPDAATRCPYCGEPNSLHDYTSPTTCVLRSKPTSEGGGYVQTRVNEPSAAYTEREQVFYAALEDIASGDWQRYPNRERHQQTTVEKYAAWVLEHAAGMVLDADAFADLSHDRETISGG